MIHITPQRFQLGKLLITPRCQKPPVLDEGISLDLPVRPRLGLLGRSRMPGAIRGGRGK